jgi:hypothetical protein
MADIYIVPDNTAPVDRLWAFLSVDQNGEGLVASNFAGHWMPMITGDERQLPKMRKAAQEIARVTGRTIKLVMLTAREELEEFKP